MSVNDGSALRSMTYDTCSANSNGQLCASSLTGGGVGYSRTMTHDSYGRPTSESTTVGSQTYVSSVTYDFLGRVDVRTFPTGYALKNVYTARGFLKEVQPNAGGAFLYKIRSRNAAGQVTLAEHGNGVSTTNTFDAYTFATTRIKGTTSAATPFDWQYGYYPWGGMEWRDENTLTGTDSSMLWQVFHDYDANGRLFSWSSAAESSSVGYDALGRIRYKSGTGGAGQTGGFAYETSVFDPVTSQTRSLPHALSVI